MRDSASVKDMSPLRRSGALDAGLCRWKIGHQRSEISFDPAEQIHEGRLAKGPL